MSVSGAPPRAHHTLEVFVAVEGISRASADKRIRQSLARWRSPGEPAADAMYMAQFLYAVDGEAEEAWRSSGTSEAYAGASGSAAAAQSDAADRLRVASLAQLHMLHYADREWAHASIEKQANLHSDDFFNTLLAPPAASWTVADFALTPVALLFGLEVYADADRLQPRLGPNAPLVGPQPLLFGDGQRRGLLDAGRVRLRLGQQPEVKVDSSNAHLVLSSLSAIARLSGPSVIPGRNESAWTLSITEDELIAFEEAMQSVAARLDRAAQVGDADFGAILTTAADNFLHFTGAKTAKGDLRQALSDESERRGRGRSPHGSWQVRAGALGAEHLIECDAAHLIPAFIGGALFEDAQAALAARSQRFGKEELPGDGRAPRLGFLDPRVGSLCRTSDAGINAAHNGLFLSRCQHALFDMHVFFVTPSRNVVHSE
ncbi:hypothetical protein FA09DRAFT_341958 [Tilletiopsis washingtonensis]|jgi:hypothetical protein|uniref:HNH nuclease domain-containing protein n=1 Tax=Tilletiopsis washingtonensis TaxID=58919 RepID=A0A316Z357_9BASI|nr:hypothetical protein FA09DRAFT_341958 [Tilletiopsis washingtonensis]PWN94605.1 hypothetical protein FA09DRAFT_341958 [Tilletiopsis washingtonensis]